jgi:hypothetical protein
MHRMGHGSMGAALIHQHATSGRDREIAAALGVRIGREAGEKTVILELTNQITGRVHAHEFLGLWRHDRRTIRCQIGERGRVGVELERQRCRWRWLWGSSEIRWVSFPATCVDPRWAGLSAPDSCA